MSPRDVRQQRRKACVCDWPGGCAGTGVEHCSGCGGDLCVCVCGGERSCNAGGGCELCTRPDDRGDGVSDNEPA